MISKKRNIDNMSSNTNNNYVIKTHKKMNSKKLKIEEDEHDEDEHDEQLILPNILKNDDDLIYLKKNHLFFHKEVSEDSVDKVKKLMRQYYDKVNSIQLKHECINFNPKPLYIHIFSPGGCAYSGFALYDFIMEYKKKIPVYTVVEGSVASAATFISIAGNKRFITPNSSMLIHQLSTMMGGNFEQIKDQFDNSKKCMEKIMGIYQLHTKITKKKIPKILKHDIEWDANESLENGLVDEIKLIDIFNDNDNNDE